MALVKVGRLAEAKVMIVPPRTKPSQFGGPGKSSVTSGVRISAGPPIKVSRCAVIMGLLVSQSVDKIE